MSSKESYFVCILCRNFSFSTYFSKIEFRAKCNKIFLDISIALKGGTFDLDNSMLHSMGKEE